MTDLEDFLRHILQGLDAAEIPYMVVGSVASSAHGNPRSTHDVDIVISPTSSQLVGLVADFKKDMYADLSSAQEAMANKSMFNVIDFKKGLKADLIFLKAREFAKTEFARRQKIEAFGTIAWTASVEDVILSKLEWSKLGNSELQYRDAFAVATTQRDTLDVSYLRRWAVELKVEELLNKLLRDLAKLPGVNPIDESTD